MKSNSHSLWSRWTFNLRLFLWLVSLALVVLIMTDCSVGAAGDANRKRTAEELEVQVEETSTQVPSVFDYEKYVSKYHKLFAFKSKTVKFMHKFQLFLARSLNIFKHNTLYATSKQFTYFLTQNMFTDMSWKQIERSYMPALSTANNNNNDDVGLSPVREALVMPDMPAEDFILNNNTISDEDGINDEYSMASGADEWPDVSPLLELKQKDEANDLDELLNSFKFVGASNREAVREAARLSASHEGGNNKLIVERARRADMARKKHELPRVKPNNPNYDPSLLPSQGLLSSVKKFAARDSDDYDDEDDDVGSDDDELQNRSLFSSMLDKISNYFVGYDNIDDDDEDDDDDDVDQNEQKQGLAVKRQRVSDQKRDRPVKRQRVSADDSDVDNGDSIREPKIMFDIDWRQTGCVSRPKNQMQCNSCYAFATLDIMEFFHCRQKNVHTEFSVQYIVDCGRKRELNGCQGGKLSNVGLFIRDFGLQLSSNYPYQASEQQCPYDSESDRQQKSYSLKPAITGWRAFDQINAWYKWLPKTPIVVGINMPADFLAYGGGVHNGLDCVPGVAHAMLLVGSGRQDGQPFWLLKNSFSSDWGEMGYFRLSKRAPLKCFNSVIVARANFNVRVAQA